MLVGTLALVALVVASLAGALVLYAPITSTPGFGLSAFAFVGVGIGTLVGAVVAVVTRGQARSSEIYGSAALGVIFAGIMGGIGFYAPLGATSGYLVSASVSLISASPTYAVVYVVFALMASLESFASLVRAALVAKGG